MSKQVRMSSTQDRSCSSSRCVTRDKGKTHEVMFARGTALVEMIRWINHMAGSCEKLILYFP